MFEICRQALTVEEYMRIYASVGWNHLLKEQMAIVLANSDFKVCVKHEGVPVGMGRTVGDKGFCYVILDVAVVPEYQGQGIGRLIMEELLGYIRETTPISNGVCAMLFSTEGNEPFYEKFGFGKKPGDGMGHGMMGLVMGEAPLHADT